MTVVVKGKSMRHLQQTCLEFPRIGPSEEYVEQKPPGLSAQIFGGGAEKFVAVTLIKLLLINIRHRLHYHQQPPEDPKSSIIADGGKVGDASPAYSGLGRSWYCRAYLLHVTCVCTMHVTAHWRWESLFQR
ncbi:hypothetical protein K443DRAFT_522297 [Laccaria amethystina LaAM-08-1]|uniref:Uncharacterized protein n=1 Tax=Laccaria amethystina LaAM-08-1 TaxID=1095629 RepID=A0A0C9WZG8_9AGAR|nr:hypothetical protein K443DRAFT_522297 [Laccaria amethystina LaAM-08-1]